MMISRVLLMVVCAFASISIARLAAAAESPTPAACGEAFTEAQRLNQEGKLLAALDQLIVCAQPSCPQFLTRECTATFERIKLSVPTVTLIAKDGSGSPLVDITVTLDGKPLASRVDGRAFPVDPGLHEFVFTREGEPPLKVTTLMSEGEKNKPIVADFGPRQSEIKTPPAAPPAAPTPPPPVKKAQGGVPVATFIFGGVGVAAIATGVVLRAKADSDYDQLVDECGRRCSEDQVDPLRKKYTYSTVAFGVGAGALLASGVFLLVGRGSSDAPTESAGARSVRLEAHVVAGGGAGVLTGRF